MSYCANSELSGPAAGVLVRPQDIADSAATARHQERCSGLLSAPASRSLHQITDQHWTAAGWHQHAAAAQTMQLAAQVHCRRSQLPFHAPPLHAFGDVLGHFHPLHVAASANYTPYGTPPASQQQHRHRTPHVGILLRRPPSADFSCQTTSPAPIRASHFSPTHTSNFVTTPTMDALPAAACLRASVSSSSSSSSSSADQDFDIDGVLVEAATVVSITSVPCEREIFVGGMPRQRSSAHAARPSPGGRGGADGFIWHADLLRALSARYGVIRLIDMNVDTSTGLPRGFAFVEFEDAWCALMCRMGLASERLIKGTLCTVDWSKGTTAGADRDDAAPADLPAAVAPAAPAATPPLSAAAAAARPCAGVDSMRGGGGSGRGGRGRGGGGGAKPRHGSNGAFCTAGTRGSSAHSVEAFDTAPQAEAWRARNERIARRLRAWAWRVCDPIAGSGDGGWRILDAHRTAAAGAAVAAAVAAAGSAAAAADASAAAGAAPAAAAAAAAAPRAARVPAGAVLREMAATALRHAAPPYAHAAATAADASAGAVAVGHAWGAAACCSAADAAATGGRRCAAVQANCCGAAAAAAEAPVFVDGNAKARTAAAAAAHMQRALEAALAAKCGGGSSGCGGTRGSSSSSSGGGSSGYDTAPLSAATSGAGTPSVPPLYGGACGALLGAACGSSRGCARSGGGSGDSGVLIR